MTSTGFDDVADLALRKSGQAIRKSQRYLVEARLAGIMRRENFASLDELTECQRARPNRMLDDEIAAALTEKKTQFFKDRKTLTHLVHELLPRAVARQTEAGEHEPLRILCAGGGTGQEAYSLAILLDEAEEAGLAPVDLEIISIDICAASTKRAEAGSFGHFDIQMGLSAQRMLKNFVRRDDQWFISDSIRNRVEFEIANLMDPFDGHDGFDFILCRNVMPQMAAPIATDLAERLSALLVPTGFLFLGPGEPLPGQVSRLRPCPEYAAAFCPADAAPVGAAA